jgi:hypothetical protein
VISPLLANIYLGELDKYVEDTLMPTYTQGGKRSPNPAYEKVRRQRKRARASGDLDEVERLTKELRKLTSYDPRQPDYRRLRYVRYADDFLLGFIGPKEEAEAIRDRLGQFLSTRLKLTLSAEKTLITHAHDGKAKFLGYEITVSKVGDLIAGDGRRATNGKIALLMPRKVVDKYIDRFSKKGRATHEPELRSETDFTVISRYQAVLRGVYNYYCMAVNVSRRMDRVRWALERSLTKTLANKLKVSVPKVYRTYETKIDGHAALQVVVPRPGKESLVATFGGFPFRRIVEGMGATDFVFRTAWFKPGGERSEIVQRLLADRCELCKAEGVPVEVHHIRKLADIDRPGRQPRELWERIMAARKRKTLVVCRDCHQAITYGRYDGPSL